MKKIYSKLEDRRIISTIIEYDEITEYRTDICPPEEYIQVCARKLRDKTTVSPHKHSLIKRETDITQEVWIVFEGKVRAKFYDMDSSYLCDAEIEKGGCMVLFRGGHSLEALEENTVFYEIKNGPYYGVSAGKELISERS
jgi:cupin fold WbuC family metalloprotein